MSHLAPTIIIRQLYTDPAFIAEVGPYIKSEYFVTLAQRTIFGIIEQYHTKYASVPPLTAIQIELDRVKMGEDLSKECNALLDECQSITDHYDREWIVNETEKFCRSRAIHNAISKSIEIYDKGEEGADQLSTIPSLLSDALSVSFDSHVGHDLFEDVEDRYKFYHRTEEKIPFSSETLNMITKGGAERKSLNALLAPSGVGKTTIMCWLAANCVKMGRNVLYITLEMSEEHISQKIDANLLNLPMEAIEDLPLKLYKKKLAAAKELYKGRLVVKEYPTSSAHVGHFRHTITELQLKKGFVPDVIFLDYLGICASARVKGNGVINSYGYLKAIAEEVRGLAVECNVPVWTGVQTNRDGYENENIGAKNTSESMGIMHTLDLYLGVIRTPELDASSRILFKQIKNRYRDENMNRVFLMGIDRSRATLYDVDPNQQPTDEPEDDADNTTQFSKISKPKRSGGIKYQ